MISHCTHLSHPPTHWQIFSPALPSDCFAIDFPRRAMSPGEGLPNFPTCPRGSGQGCPLLRASNEHSFTVRVLQARRAPGRSLPILLRPRVARAQEIIRLHPFLCSASRRTTKPRSPPPWYFSIPLWNSSPIPSSFFTHQSPDILFLSHSYSRPFHPCTLIQASTLPSATSSAWREPAPWPLPSCRPAEVDAPEHAGV